MSQEKMQGGALGGVEELYREVILDHFKSPKNRGTVPEAPIHAEGMNPLCGDQLSITANINDNVIVDVKYEGHGCAISQAAASLLTELMKGRSVDDLKALSQVYKEMLGVEEKGVPKQTKFGIDDLGDLVALEGVKKYPVRIKCALLSFNTLLQAIEDFYQKRGK
ncbi:MAG: Zinc-dependent sulfurtransferase SufU [Elusimicrobia bacterium]|nr:Zinc-dependent sulfurtransferase SufU [Elusimicrobiota bacterium]